MKDQDNDSQNEGNTAGRKDEDDSSDSAFDEQLDQDDANFSSANSNAENPEKKQEGNTEESKQEDEDIDEEEKLVTNSFKVDLIAKCAATADDLILHWAISKKNFGEWNSPDDRYLPKETIRFKDGKACQTKFTRGKDSKESLYRAIHINFQWKEEMEPAVKSMIFVLHEPKGNVWHNNGGKDYKVSFDLPTTQTTVA